jgi:hypothetical protein
VRRHLDGLALAHELERLVEREPRRRDQADQHVRGRGADVVKCFSLQAFTPVSRSGHAERHARFAR